MIDHSYSGPLGTVSAGRISQQEQDSIEENYCSVNCCSNLTHNLAAGIDSLQCQTESFFSKRGENKPLAQ